MLRAVYRGGQVWHALRPRIAPSDVSDVRAFLSPRLATLFFQMEQRDRRHALEVWTRLRGQDMTDVDLLTAALLHDCGKGSVPVWLRIAKVVSPSLVHLAGRQGSRGWRASAYRLAHHPELGAEAVEAAGGSRRTAAMIRGRVAPMDRGALALLMAADDVS